MNTNNENNSLSKQIIYDVTKFSHLDFPDHLSCIVWFVGCNMRCEYCYNKDIVFTSKGRYSLEDILSFLEQRVGLLDAVVLSGGEASNHNLISFCKKIKTMGFKIKLDTNGTNPRNIKELIDLNLIDYIALDYKAPKYKFYEVTHSKTFVFFEETLLYLLKSNINFEVRTTVHNDLIDEKDINFIINDLVEKGYKNTYFLQDFLETDNNIGNIIGSNKCLDTYQISNILNVVYR